MRPLIGQRSQEAALLQSPSLCLGFRFSTGSGIWLSILLLCSPRFFLPLSSVPSLGGVPSLRTSVVQPDCPQARRIDELFLSLRCPLQGVQVLSVFFPALRSWLRRCLHIPDLFLHNVEFFCLGGHVFDQRPAPVVPPEHPEVIFGYRLLAFISKFDHSYGPYRLSIYRLDDLARVFEPFFLDDH